MRRLSRRKRTTLPDCWVTVASFLTSFMLWVFAHVPRGVSSWYSGFLCHSVTETFVTLSINVGRVREQCVLILSSSRTGHTAALISSRSCVYISGDIGGQMGLFIGASVLTILEILDYIYEVNP